MEQQKKQPNIYLYVIQLTVIIAAVLAVVFNSLRPMHKENKANAKKGAILSCVPEKTDVTNIGAVFKERVQITAVNSEGKKIAYVGEKGDTVGLDALNSRSADVKYNSLDDIDLAQEDKIEMSQRVYPVYAYKGDKGEMYYILAVRGNGLWDKIWAYVALKSDLNTIAGIYFDHKGETPGLGAEIKDSKLFKDQFLGTKLFKGAEYVSVSVKKKGLKDKTHEVQGISGATVTSEGVGEMLKRGLNNYLPYLQTLKGSQSL